MLEDYVSKLTYYFACLFDKWSGKRWLTLGQLTELQFEQGSDLLKVIKHCLKGNLINLEENNWCSSVVLE